MSCVGLTASEDSLRENGASFIEFTARDEYLGAEQPRLGIVIIGDVTPNGLNFIKHVLSGKQGALGYEHSPDYL